jgi:organic hydroperoxide reductase OsmC/OhrA
MSEHKAVITWQRTSPEFLKGRFSREHSWSFDGGLTVPASASPAVVPTPFSNPAGIDPEEAFVASVSSCHMLTFLYLAYREGFQVDSYEDHALGRTGKDEKGTTWISSVTLQPRITFGGVKLPSAAEQEHLHQLAHDQCFVANSIRTKVSIAPIAN